MLRKLLLAHCPTPIWRHAALDELVGTEVWVKRDDMTAGAEAGNKIRKLEYLLGDAKERGATAVLTCGGVQSNHARATALLCRQLGLRPVVFLRTQEPDEQPATAGNLLLDRMANAEVRFINPSQWARRTELMQEAADQIEQQSGLAYVIPEGGSNGLGALGYVDAMQEVRSQLSAGLGPGTEGFDAVVHACGSGGTAAGIALGAARFEVAGETWAMAVCDDENYFQSTIARIVSDAQGLRNDLGSTNTVRIVDRYKGPAYGVCSQAQLRFIAQVAEVAGLVLDPVYSGKALYGLARSERKPRRALFVHTGGLPGLLAQARPVADALGTH